MNLTLKAIKKIDDFAPYAEQMPGVVIIHHVGNFNVVYMTSNGLQQLGVTLDELQQMGTEYYPRFFNIEDYETFIPKMENLLKKNDPTQSFSYFQQVKIVGKTGWTWHISSTRIFMQDDDGKPFLSITTAIPIDRMKHIEAKAERLLKENTFLRKNSKAFSSLSKREQIILKLVAIGKSSPEIAQELFISPETVQTHRRNIKQKLGISTGYEFTEYASAFDLI
ncbi:LuxR family transcriptional regulator [Mucilaginibacter hurinus]|uniref:LuxR family transcriptional regulator n=1 Tax=Mucilaginibacter hurinus TaxID=2201324 RepID=A0A367GRP5_9SPHI|nr:helix-turn-helix transcriptional regulator [Mucilaginibacter hurinus]RCH55920.1 LuxR family transcriptional regulator [Mucilaginibacter hurinus]